MKIVKLTIENIMRLSAVEITPDGAVVVIGGDNGQGKSSVLLAIEMALGGKGHAVEQPVRAGEEKGRIGIDLGEIFVERIFNAGGGTKLVVKAANGAVFPSPQAMLDHLVGKLSFDPLGFARAPLKDQAAVLRSVVGLDTKDLDEKRTAAFTKRTDVNREVDRLKRVFESLPEPAADTPDSAPDVAQLMQQLDGIRLRNASRQRLATVATAERQKVDQAKIYAESARQQVENLTQQLDRAKMELDRKSAALANAEASAAAAAEEARQAIAAVETETDLTERIKASNVVATKVLQKKERRKAWGDHTKASSLADSLTEEILAIDAEKAKRIASVSFPVPGLSVTDETVTFNGIPFSQASSAEQLRVSVAIGLALNPKLKVMIVRDGSLLDEKGLAILGELATAADAQVWVERVGKGEEVSFLIEDGHIVSPATTAELQEAST